ncbi:alc [Aeromonas phage 31]|uniref:Inhibitor of host transcription n=4 Tax=Biquartavirus TaxID=1912143 RepID=Q6U999_9CAUD|nr:inhibitor of host transcription [Aeromonas phage 44RR2.8t]YP_238930.1 inhibitor of host transcription [Aeromonas phage 31]APU00675.1 transcription terminator [Aeromonas phage 44RR2.8t.2]APU01094.1 transcription terminator [Aeromonas phage 31.2]APU02004.1 transcription terminator [Aeromonas phage L9-6]APU02256.1 transcription terminator [Aeromonas phage Riv-10]UYD59756.1 hypothetical protein JNMOADIG_00244 [Aeromonas phage avDM5]UYD60514.1 hypothetical protein NPHMPGLK_00179 [Aeromonas pha
MFTTQDIINEFAEGGYSDGIQIFAKNGREVGYITDLRQQMMKDAKKKEYSRTYAADRYNRLKDDIGPLAQDVLKELKNVFANVPAKVFINETMPNVHFMGAKFYFILSPLTQKVRVNIIHKNACRMKYVFPKSAKLEIRRGGMDIMIDGLERDAGIALVEGFARHVAEFEFNNQLAKK